MDERGRDKRAAQCDLTHRFFDRSPDMLATINAADMTISACNRALQDSLGQRSADIVGAHTLTMFHPDCHESLSKKLDQLANKGSIFCDEGRLLAASGRSIPVSTHMSAHCNKEGVLTEVYLVLRDQVLHQDAESLRLELRLQAAQKMESLAMLASGVAHDFNNLLVTIIGNAGLAAIELPPESPALPKLRDIELAASRAAELTKQLMSYSSPRDRGTQTFDLSTVVREMSHLLEIALAQNASLHYQLSSKPLSIKGDITQIRQIIMNLLTNSADAMHGNRGLIAIRTGATHVTDRYLATTLIGEGLKPGRYAYVEVADTGIGLTTEQQLRMFEPFFTTKSKGHGLGLAAVLGIVRQHAGTLRVYSEQDTGTTIKVLFPAAADELAPQISPPMPRKPDGEHILVVDDEAAVREIAQRVLAQAGFEVSVCADGNAALAKIKHSHRKFDLVLMDIGMPYLNGTDAMRMIHKLAPHQRVMLMSGFEQPDNVEQPGAMNYAGFIEKPFEATSLIAAVTAAIDSGQAVSQFKRQG